MVAQIDCLYAKHRPTKVISRLLSYALFEGRPLTTRGRWINPLLFNLFAIEKFLPQTKRVKKPIFILGTGRSGTTILGILLSMHREVAYLNEPKALWHSIYPLEDLIGSYSCGQAYYRLNDAQASPEVKKNAHKLYGAYLTATFSARVVDKYPELIFRVPFVKEIFPDAKFLFLVRNGWDTCRSIELWSKRIGYKFDGEIHDWWGINKRKWHLLVDQVVANDDLLGANIEEIKKYTDHSEMSACEWVVTMREGLKLLKERPEDVKLVRYEELTRSPKRILTEIADFCELSVDDRYLSYGERMLRPNKAKVPFGLPPTIKPAFEQTMRTLGYIK